MCTAEKPCNTQCKHIMGCEWFNNLCIFHHVRLWKNCNNFKVNTKGPKLCFSLQFSTKRPPQEKLTCKTKLLKQQLLPNIAMSFRASLVCVLPLFPLHGTYAGILEKSLGPYPSTSFSHSKSNCSQAYSSGFLHFSPEQGKSMTIFHIGVVTSNL
jgi:hypothetical protein